MPENENQFGAGQQFPLPQQGNPNGALDSFFNKSGQQGMPTFGEQGLLHGEIPDDDEDDRQNAEGDGYPEDDEEGNDDGEDREEQENEYGMGSTPFQDQNNPFGNPQPFGGASNGFPPMDGAMPAFPQAFGDGQMGAMPFGMPADVKAEKEMPSKSFKVITIGAIILAGISLVGIFVLFHSVLIKHELPMPGAKAQIEQQANSTPEVINIVSQDCITPSKANNEDSVTMIFQNRSLSDAGVQSLKASVMRCPAFKEYLLSRVKNNPNYYNYLTNKLK